MMPYIKVEERDRLNQLVQDMSRVKIDSEGTLNFLITQLCQAYVRQHPPFGYKVANAVIGALECAKLEYYRRVVSNYEDRKIVENGDVFS